LTIVYCVSGHGFGHATRSFEVIAQLQVLDPRARVVLRTGVPAWFVSQSLPATVAHTEVAADVGMVQIDSLQIDEAETARRAAAFYRTFPARVDAEARALTAERAAIVVGDIPPLAFAAADRAGVPSVACANFTWDWIYAFYPQFAHAAPGVVEAIGHAYAKTTRALRLPFHGGFATMPAIEDIPLIARRSRLGRIGARQVLGLDPQRPVVLASFGGYGAVLPYREIAAGGRFTLLLTDHEAGGTDLPSPFVRVVPGAELRTRDLRYEDLVAAADVVVTKPGYGIVSECIANGTALLYTSRGHFAEHAVLVDGMSRVLKTGFIPQEDVRAGRWTAAVEQLLGHQPPRETMATDGAAVAARRVLDLARSCS
jgi:L-arabinokinase